MKNYLKLLTFFGLLFVMAVSFNSCNKDEITTTETVETVTNKQEKLFKQFSAILSQAVSEKEVRVFIKTQALKMIDHDFDIVYGQVKDELIGDKTFEEILLDIEKDLGLSNSSTNIENALQIQPLLNISVPVNIQTWDAINVKPYIAINSNKKMIDVISPSGENMQFDSKRKPTEVFVVVGENERMFIDVKSNEYVVDPLMVLTTPKMAQRGGDCFFIFGEYFCDDFFDHDDDDDDDDGPTSSDQNTGCNNGDNFKVYLKGLRSDNLSAVEGWVAGAPEFRLNILGGSGAYSNNGLNIMNGLWEPRKRRDINGVWWNMNDYLFRWGVGRYGDIVHFSWDEEDGGVFGEEVETIEVQFGEETYSVTAPKFLKDNSTYVGTYPVYYDDCFPEFYGTNVLRMKLDL